MYNYGLEKAKDSPFATFTTGPFRYLKTIHDFPVFSYVTFTPELLKFFHAKKDRFSSSFLKTYPNFVFKVSDFQAAIMYQPLGTNRLSIQLETLQHQTELVNAIRGYREIFPGFGWSGSQIVVSFQLDCFASVSTLERVFRPTQTLL